MRAGRARAELGETQAAFAGLRARALEAWLATAESETQAREGCWRTVRTIDAVREALLAVVQDGEVAAYVEALREA